MSSFYSFAVIGGLSGNRLIFFKVGLFCLLLASLCPAYGADVEAASPKLMTPPALSLNTATGAPIMPVVTMSTNTTGGAAAFANMDTLDDKHSLAMGDRISFRIIEDNEEPKPLIVSDLGDIEVPYIGRFPAIEKTCKQLAGEIKKELEKEYYFQATVIIAVDQLTKSRGKVYLVGYVRIPGPQDIPGDEAFTLSQAIIRAGGFGEFADKKHVKLTRKTAPGVPESKPIIVDVARIIEQGKSEKDVKLEPGDLIYIPSRMINF
jgi:protein involved in polysaccharide export with SLBB domain